MNANSTSRWLRRRLQNMVATLAFSVLGCAAGAAHAGYAAVVVDDTTGKTIDEVNPDQQIYPASLTKMMTLYLTFQNLQSGKLQMDQMMPVSALAAHKAPTKLDLRAGQTVSVHDCILGMITKSANDAATVMGEGIGGSESHFAELMNQQARKLGMTNTNFRNASGLPDPSQVSTARDLSKLSRALYHDFPQYWHYFATKEFEFRGRIVRGHNHLMDRYPGMDGLKTGFTDASGFNLASTAVRDGHRLFGVVLGSRTASGRDNLMARLLDDGFEDKQTPVALVAAAGGYNNSVIHRVLDALSPVQTAQADDTVPQNHGMPSKRYRRGMRVARVSAHDSCPSRKGGRSSTCLRRHATAKSQADTRLAVSHAAAGKKAVSHRVVLAKAASAKAKTTGKAVGKGAPKATHAVKRNHSQNG